MKQTDEAGAEHKFVHYFTRKELRVSLRRLVEYGRLTRCRHLQDSIDYMQSMCRMSVEPIVSFMQEARDKLVQKAGCDPARLYVASFQSFRGKFVKSLKWHSKGKVGK